MGTYSGRNWLIPHQDSKANGFRVVDVERDAFVLELDSPDSALHVTSFLSRGDGIAIARYRAIPAEGEWHEPEFIVSKADDMCYTAFGRCCDHCSPEAVYYNPAGSTLILEQAETGAPSSS